MTLTDDDRCPGLRLGDDRYENAGEYIDALQAALRTHRKLTGEETVLVEIDPDAELGLVQRAMLR